MRGIPAVVLLMLSGSAAAQGPPDLTLAFFASQAPKYSRTTRLRAGQPATFHAEISSTRAFPPESRLELDLPGRLVQLIAPPEVACNDALPIRCTIPPVDGSLAFIHAIVIAPAAAGQTTASARVTTDPADANPSDNSVTLDLAVSDAPDLRAGATFAVSRAEPHERITAVASVTNAFGETAHDVRVVVRPTDGATIAGAESCDLAGADAICTFPVLMPGQTVHVRLMLEAPDRDSGGRFGIAVDASAKEEDFDPGDNAASASIPLVRQLRVTNTGDAGTGSLRQAMLDAATLCGSPCRIRFDLPATGGRHVIAVQSILPTLQGIVTVDGRSEIEIRGDLLSEGDGVVVGSACEVHVAGLAVTGFPGHGIVVNSIPPVVLVKCEQGVAGLEPVVIEDNLVEGNLRGIVSAGSALLAIRRNVIRGNRRSGIFLDDSIDFQISRNEIAGNGSSGIFIGDQSFGEVLDNVITSNVDFGIAVDAMTAMRRNHIAGTGHTAIDSGLDLETPNLADDSRADTPNHPVLLSASYDAAAGETIVRGRLDSDPIPYYLTNFVVEFFASGTLNAAGHAQAERFLGTIDSAGHADFEFRVKGDFRGQWIAATNTRRKVFQPLSAFRVGALRGSSLDSTSELSEPLRVAP